MKVWLQPKQYERRYRRFLGKTASQVKSEVLARLAVVIAASESTESNTEDKSDEITLILAALIVWWQYQKPNLTVTIRGLFNAISVYNDNQFRMVIRDVAKVDIPLSARIGIYSGALVTPSWELTEKFGENADIYRQEPYLEGTQKNWEATQTEYIDKVVTTAIADAGLIVRNGLATGVKAAILTAALAKLFDVLSKRVDKFGDDQTNNLDSLLTKLRQISFGLDSYEWETRRDERVRGNPFGLYPNAKPSHYERDRRIFSWSKPPEGGAPGEAPGCRCRARLVMPK